MSSAKTHIQSIITAVENLGYTFTDEFFDFDSLPTSGDDEVYRIEAQTGDIGAVSGKRVEKKKGFDIWFAFKLDIGNNRQQDFYNVLDAQEDIEDNIVMALSDIQLKVISNIMSAIKSDYIIVKCTGEFIYWRDYAA